jgi:hypothetical protein
MRGVIIIVTAALIGVSPALADSIYCSVWQGIRTCSSPDGYVSHEWNRDGMRFGDDNQGDRWTSWRWQGRDFTTVSPPPGH